MNETMSSLLDRNQHSFSRKHWTDQPFDLERDDGAEHKNDPEHGAHDKSEPEDLWLGAGRRAQTVCLSGKSRQDFVSCYWIKIHDKSYRLWKFMSNVSIVPYDISKRGQCSCFMLHYLILCSKVTRLHYTVKRINKCETGTLKKIAARCTEAV